MEEIKSKLEELNNLIKETAPEPGQGRKLKLIESHITLALKAANFKSRVRPGGPDMAKKLNASIQDQQPEEKPKKKKGRPRKKDNLLATNNRAKTLKDKLNE